MISGLWRQIRNLTVTVYCVTIFNVTYRFTFVIYQLQRLLFEGSSSGSLNKVNFRELFIFLVS